jgi:hypothetical protein
MKKALLLALSLAAVGCADIDRMPDPEMSAALDGLDSVVAGMRTEVDETQRYVDSVAAAGVTPTPMTEQEESVALIRATTAVAGRYLEISATLAEDYGVHVDPNAM